MDVNIRLTDDCYNELPVSHDNNSWFMQPLTHVLTKYATKTSCSSMPSAYRIGNQWIVLTPKLIYIQEPNGLSINKKLIVDSFKSEQILENVAEDAENKTFYESIKKSVEKYWQLLVFIGNIYCIVYVTKYGIGLWKRFKSRNSNNLLEAKVLTFKA